MPPICPQWKTSEYEMVEVADEPLALNRSTPREAELMVTSLCVLHTNTFREMTRAKAHPASLPGAASTSSIKHTSYAMRGDLPQGFRLALMDTSETPARNLDLRARSAIETPNRWPASPGPGPSPCPSLLIIIGRRKEKKSQWSCLVERVAVS
ncbi:hypothetical protein BDN67DRAFT_968378 [Paxillus ammoniavirescens]|nr:hypothetical protein BDN67DRAFT_968378 [Paxillus ammoniavirescens]